VALVALTYQYESKIAPYRAALESVGLQPVSITTASPGATLSMLQGLLLTGGCDVGDKPERDALENRLIAEALQRRLPILGICRGLQILNVHLGGSLFKDIPNHREPHAVSIAPDTRLARIVGGASCPVNSRHHQAIDRLAPGLAVTARAADGIVEAVEDPSRPFVLAVQWHPEDLIAEPVHHRIFKSFAEAID
jgi:putative glutamine amidotransferase